MRFYRGQHTHYCGVDLLTRTMCLCILGTQTGSVTGRVKLCKHLSEQISKNENESRFGVRK